MATKEKSCFIAVCDGCGDEFEHDYTPHWPSAREAADDAVNSGDWFGDESALFCDTCRYRPHAVVPDGNCCARCGIDADDHDDEPVKEPTR
jgi:hypothetical protein